MGFLKKLGSILLKATEIITGFAPLLNQVALGGAISHDLEQIAGIVVQAEVMGQVLGQPGVQKLMAAAPVVAQVILRSSLLAGRQIADPALFQRGCSEIAGGMADILSSLKGDIGTESKT